MLEQVDTHWPLLPACDFTFRAMSRLMRGQPMGVGWAAAAGSAYTGLASQPVVPTTRSPPKGSSGQTGAVTAPFMYSTNATHWPSGDHVGLLND